VPALPDLTCPTCKSEFVEEIDPTDPPIIRPVPSHSPAAPSHLPHNHSHSQPHTHHTHPLNPFISPNNDLLSMAQMVNQLWRIQGTAMNNNNATISFQAGPIPPNAFMGFNMMGGFPNIAPPLAGNIGDYVFGGNFEQILNQLFQSANHTGNPPAAKSAVDQLNQGKISETQAESKIDCAICKEEFTLGCEYIEMPCKHIFDKECILQWLPMR